jgi:hypothetical protein
MKDIRAIVVRPVKRVSPEAVIAKEPWRGELLALVKEFVDVALYPTAYGLRQVAEVLMELREIMLMDGFEYSLTKQAMEYLRSWLENAKRGHFYDLAQILREFRQYVEEMEEEEFSDGGEG